MAVRRHERIELMATALIPEVIQPGDLYVPSSNNFFSIASGTMPNTDDALICDGTAGNFRAYQPAISDIHYPATSGQDFSILMWGWSPAGTAGTSSSSNFNPAGTMMCVTDATLIGTTQATTASTVGFRWGMCPSTTGVQTTAWVIQVANASLERWAILMSTNNANNWKGIAVRHSSAVTNTLTAHDYALNSYGSDTAAGGTPGVMTSPNFAIGPYSLLTLHRSYSYIMRIAKIAIFPTAYISDTDLLELQDSMLNGPPS